VSGEEERLLAQRRTAAEAMLRDALRVDVARFVSTEVEARLLARPGFRGRFPPQALATLRDDLDRAPGELVDAAWARVRDLRVWFGAQPAEEADEVAALERTLEPVSAAVRELLRVYGFPGDEAADEPGEHAPLDLEATHTVEYRPSTNVVWAWRNLRALVDAGYELERPGAPAAPSFNLAFHLPEALAPDTQAPPTLES
jgi:hypothetical protein